MKLDELLKDKPDILASVNESIEAYNNSIEDKSKKVKFVDLSEGGYVDKDKYNTMETKYNDINSKYITLSTEHSTASKNLETANNNLKNLQDKYDQDIKNAKDSASAKVIEIAINNAISSLGIKDKVVEAGVRASIDTKKITVDDNLNIQGLDDQVASIREEHKELFTGSVIKVNTGTNPNTTSGKKQYSSLDEISKLSVQEFNSDKANILEQINKLSKK